MSIGILKVQVEHLERWAYIYVRQSSMAQVTQHQESTRRQCELKNRARLLGWSDERIVVIDQDLAACRRERFCLSKQVTYPDYEAKFQTNHPILAPKTLIKRVTNFLSDRLLGHSASDPDQVRHGFERLLADVVLGRVGAIFSLQVSRLARQDSEGHRLVEVSTMTGTLLIDEQQIYDPCLADGGASCILTSGTSYNCCFQQLYYNLSHRLAHPNLQACYICRPFFGGSLMQLLKVKAWLIVYTMLEYRVTSRTYLVVTNAVTTSCRNPSFWAFLGATCHCYTAF